MRCGVSLTVVIEPELGDNSSTFESISGGTYWYLYPFSLTLWDAWKTIKGLWKYRNGSKNMPFANIDIDLDKDIGGYMCKLTIIHVVDTIDVCDIG